MLGEKLLIIKPKFTKFMRARTELVYFIVEVLFVMRLILGFAIPFEKAMVIHEIYKVLYTILAVFLLFGSALISIIKEPANKKVNRKLNIF